MTVNVSNDTVFWHVYPLGFSGAPIRPADNSERVLTHRLRHLYNWLDYLKDLGANGLQLGPIFASATHGYDTVDHFEIDPRLGEMSDFEQLIALCDEKGISVVLDGVFNHVGAGHVLEQEDHCAETAFEGHSDLKELNHSDPAVIDYVADVMKFWLRKGIAGWRLDAAYAVDPAFWAAVVPKVREEFPDAWFVGEMIHGDYSHYVKESGLNSITEYELWKAIWSSILDKNFFELDWALQRHDDLEFLPQTFVGNHDVTRIATKVDDFGAGVAAILLFTLSGIPSIYYGDEQAYRGEKTERLGGDDEVRPLFPNEPAELSEIGSWAFALYQDLGNIRKFRPWLIESHVEKIELENHRFVYDSVGRSGERLTVSLNLDSQEAIINENGEEIYRFAR